MPRKIGIATKNQLKYSEFTEHFRRYGIVVHQIIDQLDWVQVIQELGLMGILSEQTQLFSQSQQKVLHGLPFPI